MPQNLVDPSVLEELRETGDYDRLATLLSDGWQDSPILEPDTIRYRLLAAELAGRTRRLDEMEEALAPYTEDFNMVPFGLAARVLLMSAMFHYRHNEPGEALRLASMARATAKVLDDEFTFGEAVQLEGQSFWSLERWEEAAQKFEEAISIYAGQARSYRLGLAYICLGAVLNRTGSVEEARVSLERGIRILLKSHDEYNLGVARVNVALALNVIGEHETALKYLMFAHDTFEQMGHEQYVYLTLNSIASTLIGLRDYERAETYVMRAVAMGREVGSMQIASTYEIKARVHFCRRQFDSAEKAITASLEIAAQANSPSQLIEARRTQGRLFLAQDREDEAAATLWHALDLAQDLRASLLELEVKALLAQAIATTNPVEALKMISDVEAALGERPLPDLRKDAQAARRRINSLSQEHYFILSDAKMPLLADAKISLLKWLWARALYKARGNARDAAAILGVTPTYIRKLTKIIPRDLLRPGKKRPKRK